MTLLPSFVLANTEQLHTKIHEMSTRIRDLEDALKAAHSDHPLLDPESLAIKSTMALYTGAQNDASPDSTSDSERCPGPMDIDNKVPGTPKVCYLSAFSSHHNNLQPPRQSSQELDAELLRLSNDFPLGHPSEPNIRIREYMRSKLPPRAEAEYLWEQAKENALWQ